MGDYLLRLTGEGAQNLTKILEYNYSKPHLKHYQTLLGKKYPEHPNTYRRIGLTGRVIERGYLQTDRLVTLGGNLQGYWATRRKLHNWVGYTRGALQVKEPPTMNICIFHMNRAEKNRKSLYFWGANILTRELNRGLLHVWIYGLWGHKLLF